MLDQRDFTGKAALHHAVADMEERHGVVQALLAAKAQVTQSKKSWQGLYRSTVALRPAARTRNFSVSVRPIPQRATVHVCLTNTVYSILLNRKVSAARR